MTDQEKPKLKIRIGISAIRGIGIIWIQQKYHALWLEWADGGRALLNGELKPLWIIPRIRYVHT